MPHEAARITNSLTSAPVKKFLMLDGGANPVGDPCEAEHWHGFIQYEKEPVQLISQWIKAPQNGTCERPEWHSGRYIDTELFTKHSGKL